MAYFHLSGVKLVVIYIFKLNMRNYKCELLSDLIKSFVLYEICKNFHKKGQNSIKNVR